MREIKFRAWDKKHGKMFLQEYICWFDSEYNSALIYWDYSGGGYDLYEKDIIPMQFTGLRDKNGKEIYEGDIVKCTWSDCTEEKTPRLWTYATVCFGEGEVDASDYEEYSIYIIGFYLKHIKGCDKIPKSILGYKKIEVIGNIYQNPELLETRQ